VTLLKGMLLSFSDPLLGLIPTVVLFQYNPTTVTRVFAHVAVQGETSDKRAVGAPPNEDYSVTLELDATDALESGGPLTTLFGISPRLAAIEMLMQPVGSSLLGGLVGGLLGGSAGAQIPPTRLPLIFFAWGPTRITPVLLKSLTIRETAFDDLLNPIHATADLGLSVLRKEDLPGETVAQAAADYYKAAREVKAVLQLPQILELGG
jgi:hypothetical protein